MWQLNIATLIRFFTAVLLAPCGATAKHGNYYDRKFMFFKLEKKYLLAGVINQGFLRINQTPYQHKKPTEDCRRGLDSH
jgi:hypothetical protein